MVKGFDTFKQYFAPHSDSFIVTDADEKAAVSPRCAYRTERKGRQFFYDRGKKH